MRQPLANLALLLLSRCIPKNPARTLTGDTSHRVVSLADCASLACCSVRLFATLVRRDVGRVRRHGAHGIHGWRDASEFIAIAVPSSGSYLSRSASADRTRSADRHCAVPCARTDNASESGLYFRGFRLCFHPRGWRERNFADSRLCADHTAEYRSHAHLH